MDVNAVIDEVKKIQHDHNASVDERFKQKADKGYVDSQIDEKIEKQQAAIFAKIDEIKEANDRTRQQLQEAFLFANPKDANKNAEIAATFVHQLRSEGRPIIREFGAKDVEVYRQNLLTYIRRGADATPADVRADMQVGIQPEGGYWVLPDTTGRVVTRVYETSPIRRLANVQTISTGSLKGTDDIREMDAGWVGETETPVDTDTAGPGEWEIFVNTMRARPRVSQELLDDSSVNVENYFEMKLADKFARLENNAFVLGNGSKKPRGLLSQLVATTGDDTRPWNTVQYLVTGVNGALPSSSAGDEYKKLSDFVVLLKSAYRAGAVWLMNRSVLGTIMKITDGDGRPLWQPDLRENAFGIRLLGFQVVEAEDMPDLATNSMSIAFGNFREAYQIVDRIGIRILRDPYTAPPFVRFHAFRRVGGDAVNREAYKLLKFGTS